jgi:hypothetical protein
MDPVGLQYASDEFVEGPVGGDPNRYTSPKGGGGGGSGSATGAIHHYGHENFYDASSGSWYTPTGSAGNYAQSTATGNYHNVNHAPHMSQQGHDQQHYGMSPHMETPHSHMSTTPQPLPPMSSFRGASSSNGTPVVAPTTNPSALYPPLGHQHNLQNDTLVGKALQTVNINHFL